MAINQGLSLAVQDMAIRSKFPQFRSTLRGRTVWSWEGQLKPAELADTYTLSISYGLNGFPKVRVLSPNLEKRGGHPIPHMYGQEHLCLFLPGSGEWHRGMLIANTVIPWADLWLLHYETWHATGKWMGGGKHPGLEAA